MKYFLTYYIYITLNEKYSSAVPSFSSKENAPVDWHELVYGPSISLNTILIHGLPSSID
jgi:hypothetical protein